MQMQIENDHVHDHDFKIVLASCSVCKYETMFFCMQIKHVHPNPMAVIIKRLVESVVERIRYKWISKRPDGISTQKISIPLYIDHVYISISWGFLS